MRRTLATLLAVLVVVVVGSVARAPAADAAGFVGRSGASFTLDGEPFRFVGYNDYRLPNVDGGAVCDPGRAGQGGVAVLSDAEMVDLFTSWREDSGAAVVRTWFLQRYVVEAAAGLGGGWSAFDRVLANAAAAGVRVVPVLLNNYGDCEYTSSGGYPLSTGFYASAYTVPGYGYPQSFRDYAVSVATRYAANSTVAFWQLVNEIDPAFCHAGNEAQTAADIAAFGQDVASAIKAVDPNHLVSLGTQGSGQCGTSGGYYAQVHAGSAIDLCEYHDYHEASRAMPTGNPSSPTDTGNGLQSRLDQCAALGKPLIVGEAGIVADVSASGGSSGAITTTTLDQRAAFVDAKLDAAWTAGVDGYLVWEGIPEPSDSAVNLDSGRYGIGSPLLATGGPDPTEAVLLAHADPPAGGSCSAPHVLARADFESGPAGWAAVSGPATVAVSGAQCFSGTSSLALSLGGPGTARVRTSSDLGGLAGRSVVTYRVYRPAGGPSAVRPYVVDGGGAVRLAPSASLDVGWNSVPWTVPAVSAVTELGLQLAAPSGWTGTVYLDAVEYERSGFEDGSLGGWAVAWSTGNLALSSSTAVAFTGTRSLRFALSGGPAYPAARLPSGLDGLTTGRVVTYRVYVPASAPSALTVKAFATDVAWVNVFGPDVPVVRGAWTTVTFGWPLADGGRGVGFQVNNGTGWRGTVYVDAVRW